MNIDPSIPDYDMSWDRVKVFYYELIDLCIRKQRHATDRRCGSYLT